MTESKSEMRQRNQTAKNECQENEPNKKFKLLLWKDMPKYLQFNPYIHTGYRPLLSVWGCVNSMFYIHNETLNILTHAIPIVYILVTVPQLLPWSYTHLRFLVWCHIAGILCPWIGSFFYHVFMNLERGENIYYKLLQMDMLGIWISQSFGAMPMVTATVYCLPYFLRSLIILSYSVLSLYTLYKALTALCPWDRRLCFLFPFLLRICMWCLRLTSYGGGDPAAFTHVLLQDVVSIFGGAIGAMHIPEKWFPGSLDMCWNSHNIMHILVVAAVYSMHIATMKDLTWMSRVNCNAAL
ncbi:progestin and adipoQ receptor family member 4 [Aethina tumida]|uniref:progestin and adipoQ receptor family member 4 n=1 Tax=Aethina tumida TaxID=116153 RepID=UPI00096AFBDC|nr:progestin and adipoQ receptor family member 4 [Aethina tumida]